MTIIISKKPFRDYVIGDYVITNVDPRTKTAKKINNVTDVRDISIDHLSLPETGYHNKMLYVRGDLKGASL